LFGVATLDKADHRRPKGDGIAQFLCNAQKFIDSSFKQPGNNARVARGGNGNAPMSDKNIIPSHLPSFLLPCPHCGNRMVVKAVTPVPLDGDAARSTLDDITYGCIQCDTTLTRTVRSVTLLSA
jgi:DNA-directed RNA polymerase subunit RPC12/RpoP